MVSNASDDLPEPEIPVSTTSLSRGSSRLTLRRLCSRAPRITRRSDTRAEPIWRRWRIGEHMYRHSEWPLGPSSAVAVRGDSEPNVVEELNVLHLCRAVAGERATGVAVEVDEP